MATHSAVPFLRIALFVPVLAAGLGACDKASPPGPDQPDTPAAGDDAGTEPTPAPAPGTEDGGVDPGTPPGDGGHEPPEPTPPLEDHPTDIACSSDADCMPNACCHADSCVAAGDAPTCEDTVCTMDCKAKTLDCGGSCACQDGKCVAKLVTGWGADAPQ